MAPRRNLSDVIDQMLLEIPTWEVKLKENLIWTKKEVIYQAPEIHYTLWRACGAFLQTYIPYPPVADWQWTVVGIWMVKTREELEATFKGDRDVI